LKLFQIFSIQLGFNSLNSTLNIHLEDPSDCQWISPEDASEIYNSSSSFLRQSLFGSIFNSLLAALKVYQIDEPHSIAIANVLSYIHSQFSNTAFPLLASISKSIP
jgi:hypothetical protein